MMMSGSWRRIERSTCAKVRPICGLTSIWLTPSSWYSTGSSTVKSFLSGWLRCLSDGVERRGLAAAGGPGDEQDAVRLVEQLAGSAPSSSASKPSFANSSSTLDAVEHAQHHVLAVDGRHGRDAHVDLAAAHGDADAPVLRQAALGDVEPRHDLEARDERRAERRLRRLHVLQRAVDAVADREPVLARLDMDVGGAHLHRARDELVGKPDDRRAARQILEALDVVVRVVGCRRRRLGCAGGRARRRIKPLERRLDVGERGDARRHPLSRLQFDRADGHFVERIGHGEHERVRLVGERQHLGVAQEIRAQLPRADGTSGKSSGPASGRPSLAARISATSRSDTSPSFESRARKRSPPGEARRSARSSPAWLSLPLATSASPIAASIEFLAAKAGASMRPGRNRTCRDDKPSFPPSQGAQAYVTRLPRRSRGSP